MNRALRELGFGPDDRVVVVHADDIGMCGATVDAFFELAEAGLVSSGSAMVPCPWFHAVAARCRDRDDLDVGVHLTLTSEWDGYRWGPISTRDAASGLLDDDGCFHRNQALWPRHFDVATAVDELDAQVRRALAAGIDVTHLDTHMCSVLHRGLAGGYVELGLDHRIPALLTRQPGWVAALSEPSIAAWERRGMPVFDRFLMMPLDASATAALEHAKWLFDELPAGLSYVVLHPATDTPELRSIAGDWRHRVADFETFRDPGLARHVRGLGIEVVGWRPLRELVRVATSKATAGPASR